MIFELNINNFPANALLVFCSFICLCKVAYIANNMDPDETAPGLMAFAWCCLKFVSSLTRKWPLRLQQTINFAASFLIFERNKEWYFMRIVCQQTILMKYHALIVISEKVANFEIAVCCKFNVVIYGLMKILQTRVTE